MNKKLIKGFTLIELLIVMAILGVLAVVVLVAINPVQQLARTRDAGRKSGVAQLGRSLEAYYTSHGGAYIEDTNTFVSDLSAAGEISTIPALIANNLTGYCTHLQQSGWCYDASPDLDGTAAILYSRLESQSELSKCASAATAWFLWSTEEGRGGLFCGNTEPTEADWGTGTYTFNSVQ